MKNNSRKIIGVPGCGKSTALIMTLVVGSYFIFLADRRKATARELILRNRDYDRIVYDDLDDEVGFPIDPLPETDDPNQREVDRENLLEVLTRDQGKLLAEMPQKVQRADLALHACQLLKTTPDKAAEFLRQGSLLWQHLPDGDVRSELSMLSHLHAATFMKECVPAQRMLQRALCKSPIKARYGKPTISYEQLLNEKWLFCIVGGTPEVFRTVVATHSSRLLTILEK